MNEETKRICPKCKNIYAESVGDKCPQCHETLELYEEKKTIDIVYEFIKNKFIALPPIFKKILVSILAIVILILGIFMGCKANVSHSDYEAALANIEDAKQETSKIKQEYKEYKEKMQPYEAQREADKKAAEAKAAAEKAAKEAEEKAKKEAEEKARQEAAAKAQAEKEAKEAEERANSLGFTVSEFIDKYNIQASQYNVDTAIKPKNTNGTFVNVSINNYITMDISASQSGYVNMIYMNYTNSGNKSEATMYQLACVSAAQVIDSSLSTQAGTNIMSSLATASVNDIGNDVSKTNNGIKYTMNSVMGSTVTAISK